MASSAKSLKLILSLFSKRSTSTFHLAELYRPTVNRNKDKLIELLKGKADIASQSNIARKIRELKGFYPLEMSVPSSMEELKKIKSDLEMTIRFIKDGCFKQLTVRQAWLLLLVATEVGLWFYLGETIGKMHIVGYKV